MFARLWRGIAFSTFVAPALFLGAMGVGLVSVLGAAATPPVMPKPATR